MDKIQEIYEEWIPFINKLANRYKNIVCSEEDIKNQCYLIIHKVVKEQEESPKDNFKKYLYVSLRNNISSYCANFVTPIKIDASTIKLKKQSGAKFKTRTVNERDKIVEDPQIYMWELIDIIKENDEMGIGYKYYIDDMNMTEIAQSLNTTVWQVFYKLKKIRGKLRRVLCEENV